MLFGAQSEGVNVDTARGNVLVMLVGLDQVEVLAIASGEPVVTVELQQGLVNGVSTAFEGDRHIHVVSTTSGNTRHGTSQGIASSTSNDGDVGLGEGGGDASIGNVSIIGVVEPLLTPLGVIGDVGIGLNNPDQFLGRVVEVQLEFVVGAGGGFVTSELQLFDQVFVGNLCEPPPFVGVQVDVVDEQRAGSQGANVAGEGSRDTSGGITVPVAVLGIVEFEVDFYLVILYVYTPPFGVFLMV